MATPEVGSGILAVIVDHASVLERFLSLQVLETIAALLKVASAQAIAECATTFQTLGAVLDDINDFRINFERFPHHIPFSEAQILQVPNIQRPSLTLASSRSVIQGKYQQSSAPSGAHYVDGISRAHPEPFE